ncbi:MAG: hypothetical protein HY608_00185 [Planctomycetes bacterium]|nr:hypothetical protein [Planctomycetota bacterium]
MTRTALRRGPKRILRDALEAYYRAAASYDRKAAHASVQQVRVLAQEIGTVFYLHPKDPIPPDAGALHRAVIHLLGRQYPRLGRVEMWLMEGERTLAHARADGRALPASRPESCETSAA